MTFHDKLSLASSFGHYVLDFPDITQSASLNGENRFLIQRIEPQIQTPRLCTSPIHGFNKTQAEKKIGDAQENRSFVYGKTSSAIPVFISF